MSLLPANRLCVGLLLSLSQALPAASGNQVAPPPLPQPSPIAATTPPPIPPVKSPVDFFRELLAKTPAQQKDSLTDRSPEARRQILAKVREYESLKPNVRELRLRATELQWYLWPLMNVPATNRASALAQIPPEDRTLVEVRLREWDKLPASVQKELLDNEATLRYFTEVEGRSEDQRRQILQNISPARRVKLEAGINRWRSLSNDQRRRLINRFNQFFDLTLEEKQRALNILSEPERQQIEKTLRDYSNLPPEQRAQCIRSFEKFAHLSLDERQQFLKNAERWKLMSPDERQAWRELVTKLPPPLPDPGPPLPPDYRRQAPTLPPAPSIIATNGY